MNFKSLHDLLKRTSTHIVLISLITITAYVNILQNDISFDDRDFLQNWPTIRDSNEGFSAFLSLPDLLAGELPPNHRGVYRPIRSVYYLVSLKVWGFNPFFFHLQAILVHLLIVIAIYFITNLLTKNKATSFITASLYASHPIHTEAITYTAASFDTLGILFFFASFYFYQKANKTVDRQEITRFLSLLLAFLAFFTYEMTLVLPLLIILYEISIDKLSYKNLLKRLSIYLPYFLILVCYLFVRIVLLNIGNRADYLGAAYLPASNQARLGVLEIILRYIYLLILPLNLTIFYSMPNYTLPILYKTVQTISPTGWLLQGIGRYIVIFPPLLIASLIGITLRFLKQQKIVVFCICWFLLSLLPVLNIIPQGAAMAERFLYIPSFGFCLLIAWGISKLINLPTRKSVFHKTFILGSLIFVFILSFYITKTITRNTDWKNSKALFLSALSVDPRSFLANTALASIYFEEGNYDQSIRYSAAALEADPESFQTHYKLGMAYEKKDDLNKAVSEYMLALKYEPKYYPANIALGNIYQKQSKYDEAISEYRRALIADPDNYIVRFSLAGSYLHKKDYGKAEGEYEKSLLQKPDQALVYYNLGFIKEQESNSNQAILYYKKAIELEPENSYFHLNLANIYEKIGLFPPALKEYEKALSIKPDDKQLENKIKNLSGTY